MEHARTTTEPSAPPGFLHPITLNSPLTGLCRGAVAPDPRSALGLWFLTGAEVQRGNYYPVKLSPLDVESTVTTMGRVVSVEEGGPYGAEVVMSLPGDDEKLVRALSAWFPLPVRPEPAPAVLASAAPKPEEVGLVETSDDDEADLTALAETLSAGQKSAVNNEVLRFQYDSLLNEADELERDRSFDEAFKRVQHALSIYPIAADDLHMRLAKLAMGSHKLGTALEHAQATKQLNPSRRDADHLIRQINQKRSARQTERHELNRKLEARQSRRNTLISLALFVLIIAPAVAFNLYVYVLPRGPSPESLALQSFDDVITAERALLQNEVLYLFVGEPWATLKKEQKEKTMRELVARAKRLVDTERVVVTNSVPHLLATGNRDRIRVYR